MRYLVVMSVLLLAACALFAQGFGNMMGGNQGSTIMLHTSKGLFVLRSGVLAKFNTSTLKVDKELSLFGAAPTMPADRTDRTAMQAYMTDMQRRNAPGILLVKDNSLILLVGDGFARINQDTLTVEAAATIAPEATADTTTTAPGGGAAFRMPTAAPSYLLSENTLFLMRGTEILSINVTDGKTLSRAALPKELQPTAMNFGGRNNGAGGGGGGRGNRGGGGGAAPGGAAGG